MAWTTTDWRYVTSYGKEITIGTPMTFGGTSGSIFLKNFSTNRRIELNCIAFGVGTGAGIPFGASSSHTYSPSGELGGILSKNYQEISPEDFTGYFVMSNLQFSTLLEGMTFSWVFFNIPLIRVLASATGAGAAAMAIGNLLPVLDFDVPRNTLLDSAKAIGSFWGETEGLEAFAVGAMYYYGYFNVNQ